MDFSLDALASGQGVSMARDLDLTHPSFSSAVIGGSVSPLLLSPIVKES